MRTILVVEDEALIAMDLACSLEALGYRVLGPAASGADARRIAASETPDLLLMDISLRGPDDGIDTAHAITRTHPAKVVFMSAHTDKTTRARAATLNPEAFLQKPWTTRQMQQVLNAVFA